MALHLIKLCVGADSVEDLESWIAERRRLAADRPHVVLFEDVHWADASSLDLIEHLLPLARGSPLAFVLLSRPEDGGAHLTSRPG